MQVFKLRKNGFAEIQRKILLRSIPMLLIAGAGGIAISSSNSKQNNNDVNVLPIIIPIMTVTLGFGLYRGVSRQRSLFESYTLTITSDFITREQLNTPTISIYFNDIKEITKHKNGNFTIKGRKSVDLIGIPAQIDDYSQLEATLQAIQPIAVKDKIPLLEKYQSLTGLITIGLMVCVYTVNDKIIVGLSGSALLALMVWSFIEIRRSKNIDSKTKRGFWVILLVLTSVIMVMIYKLT